jgi:glycosyltransferase-like protein
VGEREATRVALATYSTKPRGGVVHTLALAEALQAIGVDVHVIGLGDQAAGFFRPIEVPFTLIPAPAGLDSLEDRVFASVDALADGFRVIGSGFDLIHTQDCISARAAARVRAEGRCGPVVRTVHHVDDFSTRALVECQRQAILEPDVVLVVSQEWRRRLRDDYGVQAELVRNGVDPGRFPAIDPQRRQALRASVGADRREVILTVGGVEPRKGSVVLFSALGLLRRRGLDPVLAVVGGHSFQDYAGYRADALAMLPGLGLTLGADVVELGTVSDDVLGAWFRSADVLAFPSLVEGFGLVALEALAADLPVVASSLPVFREFLTDGETALLPPVGDAATLADALQRALTDAALRHRLVDAGRRVVPSFTWESSARRHAAVYAAALRRPDRSAQPW